MSIVDDLEEQEEKQVLSEIKAILGRADKFPWHWDIKFITGLHELTVEAERMIWERIRR